MKRDEVLSGRPRPRTSITVDLGTDLYERLRQIARRHNDNMSNVAYDMVEHAIRRAEDA